MSFTQRQIMLSLAYVAYTDELLVSGTPTLDAQIKADIESALSANATTPIPPIFTSTPSLTSARHDERRGLDDD